MGYDMLEGSEMGALSESRLGSKSFVDDYSYSYGTGGFLGIGRRKKVTRQIQGDKNKQWAVDPTKENDCDYLQGKMQEVKNEISYELAKNPSKKQRQRYLDPLYGAENRLKNLIQKNKCEEKVSKAEEEKFKKETEEAIQRASDSTPTIPQVQVAKGSKTTKFILIGVGLLVVTVVAVKLLKRN
jgi:hypothetical protein